MVTHDSGCSLISRLGSMVLCGLSNRYLTTGFVEATGRSTRQVRRLATFSRDKRRSAADFLSPIRVYISMDASRFLRRPRLPPVVVVYFDDEIVLK